MVYGCLLLLHLAVGGEQPDPKAVAYGGVILVMLCQILSALKIKGL